MNSYYFKKEKVIDLINKIEAGIKNKKEALEKAFLIDYKNWEIKLELDMFFKILASVKASEYLPKFSKENIVDGIGNILFVGNNSPYLVFSFIINSIYTNNKVCVALENKMKASNIAIIELIKKVLEENKYDSSCLSYIEIEQKENILKYQDDFELIYYMGNKEDYINFAKRIHVQSIFENFGEMYVYIDSKEFKEMFLEIDKFAYLNDIKVEYYNTDFENTIESINKNNNVNKISAIFTKNTDKAYEFIKNIKSENVYINMNPCENFDYKIKQDNLVYKKNIRIRK